MLGGERQRRVMQRWVTCDLREREREREISVGEDGGLGDKKREGVGYRYIGERGGEIMGWWDTFTVFLLGECY